MRENTLGQIFLRAEWVTPSQLAAAVNYSFSKMIPVGQGLKILKYITEDELTFALAVQTMLNNREITSERAADYMKRARQEGIRIKDGTTNSSIQCEVPASSESAKPSIPASLLSSGNSLFAEQKYPEAEQAFTKYKQEVEAEFGPKSLQYSDALASLANLFMTTNRLSQAEELYLKMLEIRQEILAPGHSLLDKSLEDLADLYWAQGEFDRALNFYRMCIQNREKRLPEEIIEFVELLRKIHPYFLEHEQSKGKKKTGEILINMGVIDQKNLTAALQKSRTKDVPIGTELAQSGQVSKNQLASVLSMQTMVRESKISEFIADCCMAAATHLNLTFDGFIAQSQLFKNRDEQSADYLCVLELQERLLTAELELGPRHLSVAQIAFDLAEMHASRGSTINAEVLYKRALSILGNPGDKKLLANVYACTKRLAALHLGQQKWIEAEPLLLQGLSLNQSLDKNTNDDFELLISLARAKHGQTDDMSAASMLRSGIAIMDKARSSLIAIDDLQWMVECLDSLGMSGETNRLLQSQKEFRLQHNLPIEALLNLAN